MTTNREPCHRVDLDEMVQDRPAALDCSALPFEILAHGAYDSASVRTTWTDEPRPSDAALEALIAEAWRTQKAEADRDGRCLYNGELLRYVNHRSRGTTLQLQLGPTCYRDFVGTNLVNGHRVAEIGWGRFANPVGTTATLSTACGLIVHGRRSARVAWHAGHIHTFGGALEGQDRTADGTVDVFAAVRRELREELGLQDGELSDLVCVGLIRDREIHQPELLFEARLPLTLADLLKRVREADVGDEHIAIAGLVNRAEAIVPFLRDRRPVAPVAVGALFLHGLRIAGPDWFASAVAAFNDRIR